MCLKYIVQPYFDAKQHTIEDRNKTLFLFFKYNLTLRNENQCVKIYITLNNTLNMMFYRPKIYFLKIKNVDLENKVSTHGTTLFS